jgi:hypothetical protein
MKPRLMDMPSTAIQTKEPHDILNSLLYLSGYYIVPCITVIGCFNNLIIIVVLSRPRYRRHVSCFFLKILALIDTINLWVGATIMTNNAMSTMVRVFGDAFCALIGFAVNFTLEMSSWTIIIMTLMRFVAVAFPLKAQRFLTFKAAKISFCIVLIIFFIFALPDLIHNRVPRQQHGGHLFRCILMVPIEISAAYEFAHYFTSFIIPFFILLILNTGIVLALRKRNRATLGMRTSGEHSADNMVMIMVMAVTATFLVTTLPLVIHFILFDTFALGEVVDQDQQTQGTIAYIISVIFYDINCAINFYLYFITCRKFREDLKSLIFCKSLTDLK